MKKNEKDKKKDKGMMKISIILFWKRPYTVSRNKKYWKGNIERFNIGLDSIEQIITERKKHKNLV